MAKNNRSGFLFMFILFLLLGVIIYTYKDKFYVLFNSYFSSGKKIIKEKLSKKDEDKIATEKIDLLNKNDNDDKQNDVKEKIFDNLDDIKKDINNIKEKVSENKIEKQEDSKIKNEKEIFENINNNKTKNQENKSEKIDLKLHYKDGRIYLSKVINDDKLILVSVNRNISFINTPLTETMKSLLEGPNDGEKSINLITNIPNDTKLLSVAIKDNTAYINFSNEFEYNSFGKESTITQIKQVVYTATEFTNVKYVQILINGKIKKYLGGEGILIEKPFTRGDFS